MPETTERGRLLLVDDWSVAPAYPPGVDASLLALLGLTLTVASDPPSFADATRHDDCEVILAVWPPRSPVLTELVKSAVAASPGTLLLGLSASARFESDATALHAALAAGARALLPIHQLPGLGAILQREVTQIRDRRAQDRRLSLILDAAGEGIYGVDNAGRTTFINPAGAQMVGWAAPDLIGRGQHAVLHHTRSDGSPYPKEACPIYAAFRDGAVHHVDTEVFFRKDGGSFPVDYTSTPIRERGELVGAVVTFRDITERRQAEAAIAKHQAALEQLQRELVTTMEQLVATEDMVLAGHAGAAVASTVRTALDEVSAQHARGEPTQEALARVATLLRTLEHLGEGAAPEGADLDLVPEVLAALGGAGSSHALAPSPVRARVAAEDVRAIVSQIASMFLAAPRVEVLGDAGVPSIRLEGSVAASVEVPLLFARRLVARNAGAIETLRLPGGRTAFIVRLAPPNGA